jgi:hypothetical protein
MNKYCSNEHTESAYANALADSKLNKNLVIHYRELTEGIIEIKNLISSRRKVGEEVTGTQLYLIELMDILLELRFKLTLFEELPDLSEITTGVVTDLELSEEDYIAGTNLYFHIATLTLDIDTAQQIIKEETSNGSPEPSDIKSVRDRFIQLRSIMQEKLDNAL